MAREGVTIRLIRNKSFSTKHKARCKNIVKRGLLTRPRTNGTREINSLLSSEIVRPVRSLIEFLRAAAEAAKSDAPPDGAAEAEFEPKEDRPPPPPPSPPSWPRLRPSKLPRDRPRGPAAEESPAWESEPRRERGPEVPSPTAASAAAPHKRPPLRIRLRRHPLRHLGDRGGQLVEGFVHVVPPLG